jgi:DNA-binding PadR family transcriptional regulator
MRASWSEEYIVLAMLAEGSAHGYGLHRALMGDEVLARIWKIRRSQLYFLLTKLVERGWVKSSPQRGGRGPARMMYRLSRSGRGALHRWLRTPVPAPRDLRGQFVAKLYLALRTSPTMARTLVLRQRATLRQWLQRHPSAQLTTGPAAQVLGLREAQTRAAIEYLEDLAHSRFFRSRPLRARARQAG